MIPQEVAVDNLKFDGDGIPVEEYTPVTLSPLELVETYPADVVLPIIKRNLRMWHAYYKELKPIHDELFDTFLEVIYASDETKEEKDRLSKEISDRLYNDKGTRWDGQYIAWGFTGHLHLAAVQSHIKRLEHLESLYKYEGRAGEGTITPADIDQAKLFPIGSLIEINRSGFILCPFHIEKSPSCKVFADNKFRCFGCGENGDVVDIVRKIKGVEFLDAVRFLLKR